MNRALCFVGLVTGAGLCSGLIISNVTLALGVGGGGGGARISGARMGGARSMPANYGSFQPSGSMDRGSLPNRAPAVDRQNFNRDGDQYRGEYRRVETRRGGEVDVGVTEAGNIVGRGETAGGRDYGFAGSPDGDRIVAGQTASGDYAVRAKGDFDNVRYDLPDDYEAVIHGGYTYYHHGDDYYWPYYYGGTVYYQEIYPPAGITVTGVPPQSGTVLIEDEEYLVHEGVYYQKQGDAFVVVDSPAGAEPSVEDNETKAADVITRMGDYLAGMIQFVVECEENTISPSDPGKRSITKRRIFVVRPDRMAAASLSKEDQRRFWYDGRRVRVYDQKRQVYAEIEALDTMTETFDLLRNQYGMTLPLADFLRPDVADVLRSAADSITYVGQDFVDGRICHRIAMANEEVAGDLYIDASEKEPIPRKIEFRYMNFPGQPRYESRVAIWEPVADMDTTLFDFEPQEGTARIDVVPRAKSR